MQSSFNFLQAFQRRIQEQKKELLFLCALATIALFASIFLVSGFVALSLSFAFVVLLAVQLDWALYLLVFFNFYIGWQITLSSATLQSLLGLSLANLTITAPICDYVAMIVAIALGLRWLFSFDKKQLLANALPGAGYYGLFLLSALVSVYFVYDHIVLSSLKYWLRPLLFPYVMFVFVPNAILRERKILQRALGVLVGVGFLIAFYGLTSLLAAGGGAWWFAAPYPIFGIVPLGENHNLLAEPLVVIAPIAWYFAARENKKWLYGVAGFITLIAALTLSRAAWLALGVEALIFCYFHRAHARKWLHLLVDHYTPLLFAIAAVVVYMGTFVVFSNVVVGSDQARQDMTQIAFTYARYAPWFGYGPGTFVPLLSETQYFIIEYGEALDSHGFVQKILVEEGLVGLVLFGLFLWWLFRRLWTSAKAHSQAESGLSPFLLMMVSGIVVFELFNTSYFVSTMWLPIGIALAGARLLEKE